jgi:hypothetical protein
MGKSHSISCTWPKVEVVLINKHKNRLHVVSKGNICGIGKGKIQKIY